MHVYSTISPRKTFGLNGLFLRCIRESFTPALWLRMERCFCFSFSRRLSQIFTASIISCNSTLFSQKVDIRHLNQEGASALALASLKGHLLCVRALLEADSGMCRVQDGIGRTPLNLAATAGHFDCLELLCQADRSQVKRCIALFFRAFSIIQ